MELMKEHNKEATFIVIAHRLTTVKDCDVIYVVKDGTVTAKGIFEDLINQSSLFNNLFNPENSGNL
jgi:ABC-type multidrug transport system fused ATPase/permease subunit